MSSVNTFTPTKEHPSAQVAVVSGTSVALALVTPKVQAVHLYTRLDVEGLVTFCLAMDLVLS